MFKRVCILKKRKKIKIAAFSIILVLCLTVWGITGSITSHKYKKMAELQNQQALTELCEYMDSIEETMTKTLYASSGTMLGSLTDTLGRDCAGAKSSLSLLSSGETRLHNIYRFLSQAGEFTASLNRKATAGEKITNKDRETLRTLSSYASSLSLEFEHMASLLSADYFSFDEIPEKLISADRGSENMVSYLDTIEDTEMTFEDYPTLIYDGPFSDNILTKESEILRNSEEISLIKAKEQAAEILNTDIRLLAEDGETDGRTASYCFRTDTYTISITKKGGYPLEILSDITAGEEKLSRADAVEKASNFLNMLGFLNMVSTYEASDDGICTVNFAYKDGSFICYPDLIKVSVSLTDGRITGLETTDFLMNHTERNFPDFSYTPEEAMKNLAEGLRVLKISAAVIPTKGTSEKYTYELLCEDTDGQHILIYKDIVTGEEADILILLYSDNGTLTK